MDKHGESFARLADQCRQAAVDGPKLHCEFVARYDASACYNDFIANVLSVRRHLHRPHGLPIVPLPEIDGFARGWHCAIYGLGNGKAVLRSWQRLETLIGMASRLYDLKVKADALVTWLARLLELAWAGADPRIRADRCQVVQADIETGPNRGSIPLYRIVPPPYPPERSEESDEARNAPQLWFAHLEPDLAEASACLCDLFSSLTSPAKAVGNGDNLPGEARALAVLTLHPDWTNQMIADKANVHVKSLPRWKKFKAARKMQKAQKTSYSAGHRNPRTGAAEPVHVAECIHCEDEVRPWTCPQCNEQITDACRNCHTEMKHGG